MTAAEREESEGEMRWWFQGLDEDEVLGEWKAQDGGTFEEHRNRWRREKEEDDQTFQDFVLSRWLVQQKNPVTLHTKAIKDIYSVRLADPAVVRELRALPLVHKFSPMVISWSCVAIDGGSGDLTFVMSGYGGKYARHSDTILAAEKPSRHDLERAIYIMLARYRNKFLK